MPAGITCMCDNVCEGVSWAKEWWDWLQYSHDAWSKWERRLKFCGTVSSQIPLNSKDSGISGGLAANSSAQLNLCAACVRWLDMAHQVVSIQINPIQFGWTDLIHKHVKGSCKPNRLGWSNRFQESTYGNSLQVLSYLSVNWMYKCMWRSLLYMAPESTLFGQWYMSPAPKTVSPPPRICLLWKMWAKFSEFSSGQPAGSATYRLLDRNSKRHPQLSISNLHSTKIVYLLFFVELLQHPLPNTKQILVDVFMHFIRQTSSLLTEMHWEMF